MHSCPQCKLTCLDECVANKKCGGWESMVGAGVLLGRSGTACRAPTEESATAKERGRGVSQAMGNRSWRFVGTGMNPCATERRPRNQRQRRRPEASGTKGKSRRGEGDCKFEI